MKNIRQTIYELQYMVVHFEDRQCGETMAVFELFKTLTSEHACELLSSARL